MTKFPVALAIWLAFSHLACLSGQDAKEDAAKLIATRRDNLKKLSFGDDKLQEGERKIIQLGLEQLQAALASPHAAVFDAAASDWINGEYRRFPEDKVLAILMPTLKVLEKGDKRVSQSLLLYYMSRKHGPKMKSLLPDLLARVTDDKLDAYDRGSAINAAAQIGRGDPAVVEAFITALKNPNPKNVSGVHDELIGQLSSMGKAAWPAKKAIAAMLTHPWYQDGAFLALGTLARDETPKDVAFYLDRLKQGDKISAEESAAAFLHVRLAAQLDPRGKATPEAAMAAERARPILLKIVEERPNDVYAREALRTLKALGPGGSAHAVKLFVRNLLRDHSREAVSALEAAEVTDKAAVAPLTEGLVQALARPDKYDWYTTVVLTRALGRYGKDAQPAAPHLLKALAAIKKLPDPGHADVDVFMAFVDTLAGLDAKGPGIRQAFLDVLAPDGLLKNSGKSRPLVQRRLLQALANFGLSMREVERKQELQRVREGLDSADGLVFAAAAHFLVRNETLTKEEGKPFTPLLVRVLEEKFAFTKEAAGEHDLHTARLSALKALGSLGAAASDAIPVLKAWAKKPLAEPLPSFSRFSSDPPINQLIREAERTLRRIHMAIRRKAKNRIRVVVKVATLQANRRRPRHCARAYITVRDSAAWIRSRIRKNAGSGRTPHSCECGYISIAHGHLVHVE